MKKQKNFRIMPEGYGKASKEVRDYITKLQQENEKLKLRNEMLEIIMFRLIRKEIFNEKI